jgi:hypothetical protein
MSYIQWLHQVDAFSCCYYALKLLPKLKNKNKNQNQKYTTLIKILTPNYFRNFIIYFNYYLS